MSKCVEHLNNLLGYEVQDKVTKFKGVVSSISFDLYGCIQAIVTPFAKEDGSIGDSHWFDISRLNVLSDQPVMAIPDYIKGDISEGKHGSADKPVSSRF